MRILALTKYGTLAASTRQRFQQYEPYLSRVGIEVEYSPLFDNDYLTPLLSGRRRSVGPVIRGYWRRLGAVLRARSFDALWVHCELFPYLPGFVEGLAARLGGRPIIFDFDDAIFHMYDENASLLVRTLLEGKLAPLLRRASACMCGNAYLQAYAARYCPQSVIISTVVDTDRYQPRASTDWGGPVVIGWIGSPSTWPNVRPLLPLLSELCDTHGGRLCVVGAGEAAKGDLFPGLDLVDWSESSEIANVQAMDIGIMPLVDRPFERGKSGYKLIQYMACGLPVVASPVGVNREIVTQGENGFLATGGAEWREALERLIADGALRRKMGEAGRERAVTDYSVASQAPRVVELLRDVAKRRSR